MSADGKEIAFSLTEDQIRTLLKKFKMLDRQGYHAVKGEPVNARAIFNVVDDVLEMLCASNSTGRFRELYELDQALRRRLTDIFGRVGVVDTAVRPDLNEGDAEA